MEKSPARDDGRPRRGAVRHEDGAGHRRPVVLLDRAALEGAAGRAAQGTGRRSRRRSSSSRSRRSSARSARSRSTRDGNLAAGTSTGGMTNKHTAASATRRSSAPARTPTTNPCAVSGTGHGEFFIRWTVAHDIAALVKYRGMTVAAGRRRSDPQEARAGQRRRRRDHPRRARATSPCPSTARGCTAAGSARTACRTWRSTRTNRLPL